MLSVVIPVFNSAGIVGTTVDRTVDALSSLGLAFEVICVNDGSQDGSWDVLQEKAAEHPQVIALDLVRNYGQHSANLAGLRQAKGDWVVTMDDDLQNPPEEIVELMRAAADGSHDVVFGEFRQKQAAAMRRLGTRNFR